MPGFAPARYGYSSMTRMIRSGYLGNARQCVGKTAIEDVGGAAVVIGFCNGVGERREILLNTVLLRCIEDRLLVPAKFRNQSCFADTPLSIDNGELKLCALIHLI